MFSLNKKSLLLLAVIGSFAYAHSATLTTEYIEQSPSHATTRLSFKLDPSEVVYKDFISISANHPHIEVASWQPNIEAVSQYVPELRTQKDVFDQDFFIDVHTQLTNNIDTPHANLHVAYQASPHYAAEQSIPLQFASNDVNTHHSSQTTHNNPGPTSSTSIKQAATSWSSYLENLIKSTDLLIVRILLIMLLGLLMSFTPCIYPMIPITIGIMQGQSNKTLTRSFLHAFLYSMGIATTFSLLGLLAALSGTIFGMLLTNPIVVLLIVAMLVYLALSMFGLYEMRIPSFLQANSHKHKATFLSSFIFGALSGTVASPCLSPGLALVLCIVASLGNVFLGFLLLFSFGVGLSIPLLLIGTFSSSLNLLPRAGTWMIEVKKIFGFLLMGMSFYYLKNILPHTILLWLIALFCAGSGIYYLLSGSERETKFIKRLKIIIGIIFLTGSIHLAFQAYEQQSEQEKPDTFWITDYTTALVQARENNKYIFFDFWAPSCSICTAIDKTLLKDPHVRDALSSFIPTKLELDVTEPAIMELKERFEIMGLPAFILYDPANDTVIKRWGSELYNSDKNVFIQELNKLR